MRAKRSIKDSLKEYLNWCVSRLLLGGSRNDTVRDMVDAISDEIASGGGIVSQDQLDQTVQDITKSYGIADQTVLTSAESYTDQKIADVVDGSPEALDTLYELAKALGDDSNFATTVMDQIGQKLPTTTFENFIDNKAWTKDNLTKLSQLINNINSIKATRVKSMDVNLASISSYLEYDLFDNNTTGTKPPGLTTGFLLTFSWDNGGWGAQIATSDGNVDGAIFLRTIKASESDKIWGPWVSLYNTANFNPANKFGFSADQLSDLNNAPNNAFFVGAYNATNSPVQNSWSNGFTIAYGNNTDFRKQFCYAGEKWWTRGRSGTNWGAWRQVWDSGNLNPGNYLLLSGGTMTGDIAFGSNGRSLRGSDGGNIAGVLYDTPNARYVTAIGTGIRRLILVSPASIYRGAGGVAENYMIYDSGNLGNATTSKAGLMSAADKTKLDGLSGGGLNIPAYIFPGDPSKLDSSASPTTITSILGTASDFLDAFNNGKVFVSKTVTFSGVSIPSDITYNVLKSEDPDTPTIFQIIMCTIIWSHYIEVTIDFENNEYQAITGTINGRISVNTAGTSN